MVFVDESGDSERPSRIKTWGIRSETPVVQFHFNWHQLSLIAGMHFNGVCFRLHDGTRQGTGGRVPQGPARPLAPAAAHPVGPPSGTSQQVGARLRRLDGRRHQASLPSRLCARPQPVEFLWARLKRHALANYCPIASPSCDTLPAANSSRHSAAASSLGRAGSELNCSDVTLLAAALSASTREQTSMVVFRLACTGLRARQAERRVGGLVAVPAEVFRR